MNIQRNLVLFLSLATSSLSSGNSKSFGLLLICLILVAKKSSRFISFSQDIATHDVIVSSMGIIDFCPYMSLTRMNPFTELWAVLSAHKAEGNNWVWSLTQDSQALMLALTLRPCFWVISNHEGELQFNLFKELYRFMSVQLSPIYHYLSNVTI